MYLNMYLNHCKYEYFETMRNQTVYLELSMQVAHSA